MAFSDTIVSFALLKPRWDFQIKFKKNLTNLKRWRILVTVKGASPDTFKNEKEKKMTQENKIEQVPVVIIVRDGVVDQTFRHKTPDEAEKCFIDNIEKFDSKNFKELNERDLAASIEDGYYEFSDGSVNLTWI